MRINPIILMLCAALLAIWIMYPTLKNNMLTEDNNVTTTYELIDGQLVEQIQY